MSLLHGSSIDGEFAIFDWRFFFVNFKWIYTAVARAKNSNMFSFFAGPSAEHDDTVLDNYLTTHVENYKKLDLQRGRPITDNFTTPAWIKACGDCFRFDIKGKVVESNLSADRVDNDECHHLNNVVPLCVTCNQSKSCW